MRSIVLLAALMAMRLAAIDAPVPTVSLCQAFANPAQFEGKQIRVSGLYEQGFEKSALTAPGCASKAWVTNAGKITTKWAAPLDVVLVVRFHSGKAYGHLGQYPFLVEVLTVDSSKPIQQ